MISLLLAAGAALLLSTAALAETPSYENLLMTAREGFEAEDWRKTADALDAAQTMRPYSLYLTRNRVLAYAMLGDTKAAAALAKRIADRGIAISFTGHPALEALAESVDFAPIAAQMQKNQMPIGVSEIILNIDDNSLLPESFAAAGKNGPYYIGSVRTGKIVRITSSEHEGFAIADGGVYDLEVEDDILWAAVNSAPPYDRADSESSAAIIAFDAQTGAAINSYKVDGDAALLGDLELTPNGLIASDSITPRLFALREDADAPAVFVEDPRFVNLQGLAYDKTTNRLFIADYLAGLFAVDMETRKATLLENVSDAHLGGIDGLYFYKGDLIGIQNGVTPQRIVRIRLNKDGDQALALEVIQQNLPEWREPTNGKIVGKNLYYVATSNWPAYGDDGAVKLDVERAPVQIMSAPLNK